MHKNVVFSEAQQKKNTHTIQWQRGIEQKDS